MYKRIDKSSSIFQSKEFLKDESKYYNLLKNLDSEFLKLISDEENYIFCNGDEKYPTWIWTKDNLDKNKYQELIEVINLYLSDEKKSRFICKKELYDLLIENNYEHLNKNSYFEYGYLDCKEPIKPKENDGKVYLATKVDYNKLIEYFYNYHIEIGSKTDIESIKDKVNKYISKNSLFVLKNKDQKIVASATCGTYDRYGKISSVFTTKEERKKGYAATLVYEISKKILKDGYLPLLYTDYNYPNSNKAYKNSGFKDKGILIEFSCNKEKVKTY